MALAAVVVVVLAGAGYGLSALLSSSGNQAGQSGPVASAPALPTVPPSPPTTTTPAPPTTVTPAPPTTTTPAPPTTTTPASPATTTPASPATAVPAPRPLNWLGMQIATQPPGAAVVQTVQIGSAADRAGISPGDVIVSVDGRALHGTEDIAGALHGLSRGDRVTLQIAYGSGSSQAVVTLGAPPSVAP